VSALEFEGFLLLLMHILIGWRPLIKEPAAAFMLLISGTLWLHRNLSARCGFGCELQMLPLQWEEKWKL